MTVCELREANLADAANIASLHAESWRSAYRGMLRDEFLDGDIFPERAALWEQRLSAPQADQLVLLALDRSSLIGFACVFGAADPQWGAQRPESPCKEARTTNPLTVTNWCFGV